MLKRRLRNLTLVCINWPVVKLVSLYIVLFKMPIDDIEDLLFCYPQWKEWALGPHVSSYHSCYWLALASVSMLVNCGYWSFTWKHTVRRRNTIKVVGIKGILSKVFQLSFLSVWVLRCNQVNRRWRSWEKKGMLLRTFTPNKRSGNYSMNEILLIDWHPQTAVWVLQFSSWQTFPQPSGN